jgi:hypothetical protein
MMMLVLNISLCQGPIPTQPRPQKNPRRLFNGIVARPVHALKQPPLCSALVQLISGTEPRLGLAATSSRRALTSSARALLAGVTLPGGSIVQVAIDPLDRDRPGATRLHG